MSAVILWGWDEDAKIYRRVLVDTDGKLRISDADPFEVVQDTPQDLKHVPHGRVAGNGAYLPFAVDANGKLQIAIAALDYLNSIGDVNVPTPTDGDFIEWDSTTSKWIKIAHKDAATGVHGVGSDYIAKSSVDGLDLAAHEARHKWLGADEVELYDTFFAKMPLLVIDSDWGEASKWTRFTENTGSWTQKLLHSELKSGATINSEVGIYSGSMWIDAATAEYKPRLMIRIQTTNITDMKWAFGFFEHNPDTTDPATQVTNKDKCLAFYAEDNKLYAVVGDGTNLTKTEIDTLAGGHIYDLYLRGRAADAIDFYISDNAAAYTLSTLTTYNPAAGMLYLVIWMENFAAVAKQINVYGNMKLLIGAPF